MGDEVLGDLAVGAAAQPARVRAAGPGLGALRVEDEGEDVREPFMIVWSNSGFTSRSIMAIDF